MSLRRCSLVFVATGAFFPALAQGGSETAPKDNPHLFEAAACEPPADTEFRVGIPSWLFGVRGLVLNEEKDVTEILRRLDTIASASFYARYRRWNSWLMANISSCTTPPSWKD